MMMNGDVRSANPPLSLDDDQSESFSVYRRNVSTPALMPGEGYALTRDAGVEWVGEDCEFSSSSHWNQEQQAASISAEPVEGLISRPERPNEGLVRQNTREALLLLVAALEKETSLSTTGSSSTNVGEKSNEESTCSNFDKQDVLKDAVHHPAEHTHHEANGQSPGPAPLSHNSSTSSKKDVHLQHEPEIEEVDSGLIRIADSAHGASDTGDLARMGSVLNKATSVPEDVGRKQQQRPLLAVSLTSGGRSVSQFSVRATLGGNVDLSWHHVTITLPKNEHAKTRTDKVILHDVNGRVEAGNLMALMGASGAGKTTFLNFLSGRSASVLETEGTLAINGKAVSTSSIRRTAAYVQQKDVFLPNLTVKEHLMIQAMLRMDNRLSEKEREEHVDSVMEEIGLQGIATTRIGHPTTGARGISGGEAKRLAFAAEVLTDPPLLFADEPTSGLDSFAANTVIASLKTLAENGRTIICTIHQPPSEVFLRFHKLLLFAEGRTAYLGSVAGAPAEFARLGFVCPAHYNYADFYINTLSIAPGEEEESRARVKVVTDAYKTKEEAAGIAQAPEQDTQAIDKAVQELCCTRGEPWYTQLYYIMWRSWISTTREFQVVVVQLFQTLVVALLFSGVFWQIDTGNGQPRVQNFVGATMMILTNVTFTNLYPVVNVVPSETAILVRDHDNNMYRTWVFFVSKFLADLPIPFLYLLVYCSITYFMIGYQTDVVKFFIFVGILAMLLMCVKALALALVVPATIPLMLFSGAFVNPDNTPVYFIWLEYISFFKYSFEGLLINEFDNYTLPGNCTEQALICYDDGSQVLARLSLGEGIDRIQWDVIIMACLFVGFSTLAFITLTLRLHFLKR
eukprot:scpid29605/ scgid1650/ Protein white